MYFKSKGKYRHFKTYKSQKHSAAANPHDKRSSNSLRQKKKKNDARLKYESAQRNGEQQKYYVGKYVNVLFII